MKKLVFQILKILFFCTFMRSLNAEVAPKVFDLELNQVPVSEAFDLLGEASGKTILFQHTSSSNKRISLAIHQESFEQAFAQLLKTSGLSSRQKGDILEVGDPRTWKTELPLEPSLSLEVFPIRFGNTQEIFEVIKQSGCLSPKAKLSIDHTLNILLLQGTLADGEEVRMILKTLDIPPVQVLIEARIVEVDEQALKAFGVNIANLSLHHPVFNAIGQTSVPVNDSAGNLSLNFADLPAGLALDVALQALETQGNGQVVSAPNLVVSEGQTAVIEQGAEVPYATESENGNSHVQFKKAVMGLTVTPRVINQQEVLLNLEVSKDAVSNVNLASARNEPLINTQEIKTQVRVADKKTIVLGGIIETNQEKTVRKVPVLGDLPLLGKLFSSTQTLKKRKQIVIFVTPTILKTEEV